MSVEIAVSISVWLLIFGFMSLDSFSIVENFFQFMYLLGFGGEGPIGELWTSRSIGLWSEKSSFKLVI